MQSETPSWIRTDSKIPYFVVAGEVALQLDIASLRRDLSADWPLVSNVYNRPAFAIDGTFTKLFCPNPNGSFALIVLMPEGMELRDRHPSELFKLVLDASWTKISKRLEELGALDAKAKSIHLEIAEMA